MGVFSVRTATDRPGTTDTSWTASHRGGDFVMRSPSETCRRSLTSFQGGISSQSVWSASCWRAEAMAVMGRMSFTIERKLERFFFMRGATTFGQISPRRISMSISLFSRGSGFRVTGGRIASRVVSRKRRRGRSCSCTFSCTSLATTTTAYTRSIQILAKVRIMQRGLRPVVSSSCFRHMCASLVIQRGGANKSVETNRRPASPFSARLQFKSPSCAPPFVSAAVAHLCRSATSHHTTNKRA
jgi:hypothetical protein